MDMLETYLEAVAAQLPRDTREDIVAELRDTLLSQIEDREAALDRPLTEDEQEAVLRAMGHPLVVAARYRKGPQSLLGPELFPYWLFAVKVGVLILAAVYGINMLPRLLSGAIDPGRAIAQSFQGLFGSGLALIGAVTLAGALSEHFGLRPGYLDNWRVKDLQFFKIGDPVTWATDMASGLGPGHAGAGPARPRPSVPGSRGPSFAGSFSGPRPRFRAQGRVWPGSQALASLIAGLVFLAWWVGIFHLPGLVTVGTHGEDATLSPAPVWTTLYVPILVYVLLGIAVDVLGVLKPAAVRLRGALQIPIALGGLLILWLLVSAGDWFVISRAGESATIRASTALLDPDAWASLGNHETMAAAAASLSVILTWTAAVIAFSLVLRMLGSLWRVLVGR